MDRESSSNDRSEDSEAAPSIGHIGHTTEQPPQNNHSKSRGNSDGSNLSRAKSKSQQRKQSAMGRWERPSSFFHDQYLKLFENITDDGVNLKHAHLKTTQIGSVIWSATEKDKLFRTLSRKSRVDVGGIAAAIGTKSELEVSAFLRLLEDEYQRRQLHGQGKAELLDFVDFPAATEIGGDCEAMLDEAANALALHQDKLDRTVGEQAHGDFWLIDHAKAKALDGLVDMPEGSRPPDVPLAGKASLLDGNIFKFSGWLSLSQQIYMRPTDYASDNVRADQQARDESPAITHDAFSDFHRLAVDHLRKLIQSSIFYAESRNRCTQERGHKAETLVRAQDVTTAVDLMAVSRDSSQFWIQLARRNQIRVVDVPYRGGLQCGRLLSYEEIERRLGYTSNSERLIPSRSSASEPLYSAGEASGHITLGRTLCPSHQDESHADDSTAMDSDEYSILHPSDVEGLAMLTDREDDQVERSDRYNSFSEEFRLYRDLGFEAP